MLIHFSQYLINFGFTKEDFEVESAGSDPSSINPDAVAIMAEEGMKLSGKNTQKAFDLFTQGRHLDLVITYSVK